ILRQPLLGPLQRLNPRPLVLPRHRRPELPPWIEALGTLPPLLLQHPTHPRNLPELAVRSLAPSHIRPHELEHLRVGEPLEPRRPSQHELDLVGHRVLKELPRPHNPSHLPEPHIRAGRPFPLSSP